ncbi:MAG: sugar ABC transporter permease [Oscillospiraceae bacterium]|nr:sugar ABC transporter permease [Oscillospiraceae bacterium]
MQTRSFNARMQIIYFCMAIPAMLIITIFIIFPVLYNFLISFTNFTLRAKDSGFVGFQNYIRFFTRPETLTVVKNTLHYMLGVITVQFLLGFCSALALSYMKKGRAFASAVLFMPWVVSQVMAVTAWRLLFNDSYGLVNYFFVYLGLEPVKWFSNLDTVMWTVMGLNMWAGYGFTMTIMLAALKSVPIELYEAAHVDGASWFKRLFYITLPMIVYSIATNLILITIYTFNIFTYVFALTGGGPLNRTEVIGLTMYNTAFVSGRMGAGAAIAIVMIAFNLILAAIYMKMLKKADNDAL